MDVLAPVKAFDRYQQRHKPLAVPIAVIKKFSDDGAGNAAALIAYYGFFSLFPLLLVFVTILGFVLQGNPSAQHHIEQSVLRQFPVVGDSIQAHALTGSTTGLVVGIVGAILSGLGITLAAQNAFNKVYAVPHRERPNFLVGRLRGLELLVVFGVLQILSTVASGLAGGGAGGIGMKVLAIGVSLLLNLVLFFAVFRLLTDDSVPTRDLRPGIITATIGWEILQAVGGLYINHVVKGANTTYGTFATVLGLLVWLFLGARVVVYAAEINTVLTRRLWPRALLGEPPLPADREVRTALAKVEERSDNERVSVTFHHEDQGDPPAAQG